MKNIKLKTNRLVLSKKIKVVLLLSVLFFAPVGIFFITKGNTPFNSELSFTEHSTLGEDAGSVIPASCESSIGHYPGDCDGPSVGISFNSAPNPTTISVLLQPSHLSVAYGTNLTLTWTVTGANACTASGDWSGEKNPAGGSEVIANTSTGSALIQKTYRLTCSNASGKGRKRRQVSVTNIPNGFVPAAE